MFAAMCQRIRCPIHSDTQLVLTRGGLQCPRELCPTPIRTTRASQKPWVWPSGWDVKTGKGGTIRG